MDGILKYRGDKVLVANHSIGSKYTKYNYKLNSAYRDYYSSPEGKRKWMKLALPNTHVLWSEVVEGRKKTQYTFKHLMRYTKYHTSIMTTENYRKKLSYYYSDTPIIYTHDYDIKNFIEFDRYVAPVVTTCKTLSDDQLVEEIVYDYGNNTSVPQTEPLLERHLRGGVEKYRITRTYDTWENVLTETDSRTGLAKTITYYAHDTAQNLPETVAVTNQNPVTGISSQVITTYDYNSGYLKPETITVNDGSQKIITRFSYYDNGNLKTKISPNGLQETIEYETTYSAYPARRIYTGIEDADGNAVSNIINQYGYNYYGQKEWEMDGRGYVTQYRYDGLDRLIKVFLPTDNDTPFAQPATGQDPSRNPDREYDFDDAANTCAYWNENRKKSVYAFDGLGRLIATTHVNGQSRYSAADSQTLYHYNSDGQIDYVTDPNDKVTTYEYDGLGRVNKIIYPTETSGEESNATLTYDDTTNTVTVKQENGNIIVQQKDWVDRLVSATQQAVFGSETATYEWSFQYDSLVNKVQETNPFTKVTDYTYDTLGHLEKVELPAESLATIGGSTKTAVDTLSERRPTTNSVYDVMGNKTSETDANGNQTTYGYDVLGRLLWTKIRTTQTNVSTKLTETVTATTKYFYDANGNKVNMVDPSGHSWLYTYSTRGFLLSETDPLGNTTRYRYDPMGNKIAVIDPRNTTESTTIWYSLAGNDLVFNDPRSDKSYTTWYLYDDYNRLYRTVLPDVAPPSNPFESTPGYDNPYIETWYDLVGNKVTERDPNGAETTYTYYPRNWVHTKTGPDSKEEYEYDAIGNQNKINIWTDRNAGTYYTITKNYDSLGRLREVIKPRSKESYTYDAFGNRTAVVDGNGYTTRYTYNNLGWLTAVTDPLERQTAYRYDPNGNQIATITPGGLYLIKVYDEQNRVKESIDSLSQSTLYNYDAAGNRQAMLDVRGTKWVYEYYDQNLIKQLTLTGTDNSAYSVIYEYDAAGNRTKVSDTNAIKNVITYEPDAQNRVTSILRTFDSATYKTNYQYTNLGQIAEITYPEATANIVYKYDTANRLAAVTGYTGSTGIVYDADGLVKTISLANGATNTFSYDEGRRLKNITAGTATSTLINTGYTYDSVNNMLTSADSVTGLASVYTYYKNNWLQAESTTTTFYEKTTGDPGYIAHDDAGSKILDYTTPEATVSLDYASTSVGIDFGEKYTPNVKIIKLIPDKDHQTNRLVKRGLEVFTSSDNVHFTKVTGFTFSKDSGGVITLTLTNAVQPRVVKVHCVIDDTVSGVSVNKATFLNSLADMIRVYEEVDGTKVGTYEYDNDGNRTLRSIKLSIKTTENKYFYYPDSNRLMTNGYYGYVYDAAGNLVEKGNKYTIASDQMTITTKSGTGVEYWKYGYDLLNRLVKVQKNGKTVVEYGYDPEGMRVVKKSTENWTTHYVFDGNEPIFEKQISSGIIRSYIYALGKHLARVDGVIGSTTAKTYYYHTDNVGSIRKITNSAGTVVWDANYVAFGSQYNQGGSITELHSFTGKELDPDTGLYYFNARWYDSELGRFVSEDSAQDGDNWYVYCSNNPLIATDPTGMYEILDGEPGTSSEFSIVYDEHSASGYHILNGGDYFPNPVSLAIANTLFTGDMRYWNSNSILSDPSKYNHPVVKFGIKSEIRAFYDQEYLENLNTFFLMSSIMPELSNSVNGFIVSSFERNSFAYNFSSKLAKAKGSTNKISKLRNSLRAMSSERGSIDLSGFSKANIKASQGLVGKDFENFLTKTLGGNGSFSRGGRDFDGGVGNRWWEAKSGQYWSFVTSSEKNLTKFKSDMGDRLNIAKQYGATYELHSNTPIPQEVQNWLIKKGISFAEWK
jgi:RHS repeat-associated protein